LFLKLQRVFDFSQASVLLIRSYLSDRWQVVSVGGSVSRPVSYKWLRVFIRVPFWDLYSVLFS
jgi:hypothetical protein